jgi:hypothetical protein
LSGRSTSQFAGRARRYRPDNEPERDVERRLETGSDNKAPPLNPQVLGSSPRGRTVKASNPLESREQQVLPVHDRLARTLVVALGQFSEITVECSHLVGVRGDASVRGDGRPVPGLEVVAKRLWLSKAVDSYCLAACRDVGDPLAQQRADVVFVTPKRWRLRAGRGRRVSSRRTSDR